MAASPTGPRLRPSTISRIGPTTTHGVALLSAASRVTTRRVAGMTEATIAAATPITPPTSSPLAAAPAVALSARR